MVLGLDGVGWSWMALDGTGWQGLDVSGSGWRLHAPCSKYPAPVWNLPRRACSLLVWVSQPPPFSRRMHLSPRGLHPRDLCLQRMWMPLSRSSLRVKSWPRAPWPLRRQPCLRRQEPQTLPRVLTALWPVPSAPQMGTKSSLYLWCRQGPQPRKRRCESWALAAFHATQMPATWDLQGTGTAATHQSDRSALCPSNMVLSPLRPQVRTPSSCTPATMSFACCPLHARPWLPLVLC